MLRGGLDAGQYPQPHHPAGNLALIAKTAKEDAGFILISQAADQAEILSIGVKPACRRAGIASTLLRSSIARLEHWPVKNLFLDVARSSQPARALYSGFGFQRTGIRKNYYRKNSEWTEDALQYQLLIDNSHKKSTSA